MRPERISSRELATLLGRGLNWSSSWFSPYQSSWSLTRKLSLASVVPHEDVLRLLAGTDEFDPWMWAVKTDALVGSPLLAALFDVQEDAVETCWLNPFVRSVREPVVARSLRYCAQCMENDFHSTLYQLHLLEKCPVHEVLLTTNCPHCGFRQDEPSRSVESFTRCVRCTREMFPPTIDWLTRFKWCPSDGILDGVASKLRIRQDSTYVESLWKPWDLPSLRRGVSQRPFFAALGRHLLSQRGHGYMEFKSCEVATRAEAALSTSLRIKRSFAQVLGAEIQHLAQLRGLHVPKTAFLDASIAHQDARALWMASRCLGINVEHRIRSDFNEEQVIGTLVSDRGWMLRDGEATNQILRATARGLFVDARDWLSEIPQGYRWDDWFQQHRARTHPPVWTANVLSRETQDSSQKWEVHGTGHAARI